MKNLFNIEITTKKPEIIDGLLSHWGRISIGSFSEQFVIPIDSWSLDQYKQQWTNGFERIKSHNQSCLVTTIQNLKTNPLIEVWTIYKQDSAIYFHNQLLNRTIAKELHLPFALTSFDSHNCYLCIYPRLINRSGNAINKDGEEISEWSISTHEFFDSLKEL